MVNSSAGKDSQAALDVVAHQARATDTLDRVVVLHCDLGRIEWPGTAGLAAAQAAHYGLPLHIRAADGPDLLERITARSKFPDAARRWCTSDLKRGPKHKFLTEQVRALNLDRPARILDVTGERAAESRARAAKPPFAVNTAATTKTTRHVWTWRPIHAWTTDQVWARIHSSGAPFSPVYAAGMSRLSCSFCILASRADLLRACQLRPDLAAEYAAVESRIGHTFKPGVAIADLIHQAQS